MPSLKLRQYQQDAVGTFFDRVLNHNCRSGVIAAPTGSGKSLILSDICRTMQTQWPHTRIVVATHRKELIAQNEAEFSAYYQGARTGIYSAGLNSRDNDRPVIFAGIQTVAKRGFEFGKIDLLIIDEAHLVNPKEGTQYARFIGDLKIANPNLVVLGLSATPYRLDNGLIYGDGDKYLFDELIYDIDIADLILQGYLCPVISKGAVKGIDLSNIKMVAGEYNKGQLEEAAAELDLVRSSVRETIAYGQDREAWLIFCTGKRHARLVYDEMQASGVSCAIVDSDTSDRDDVIGRFKAGEFKALINIDVLTTGFNDPRIDLVALMMATKSTCKYVQCVGRGTRIAPHKENCLLLDFGGNVLEHGPIDAVTPKSVGGGKKKDKKQGKECPECAEIVAVSTRTCPRCGHEWPKPEIKHDDVAYDGSVLASQDVPEWYEVDEVEYTRHDGKNGKPDTLKCTFYVCERIQPFMQWIAPDHSGYAKRKAQEYIAMVGGKAQTVDECLKENLYWKDPKKILVGRDQKNKKYFRILAFDMPDEVPTMQSALCQ
jgi:DNA repair protein RadD